MSREFPDLPYLERIREALWRQGRDGHAAVMVGAGLSSNARARGNKIGKKFPDWSDLSRIVVDHLYPEREGLYSAHRIQANLQVNATSGFLRLAQEYESAFGKDALEFLIASAVPDLDFEPDAIHYRLLALPWSDVFTTNWDTLLERATARVINRHYRTVRATAEIPGSTRPRIIKLHGSLGSGSPLVFTEEDFRKYPTLHAPFVNLAQQSMMENVFCLVGFSGDDPNFLHWSGWVRDHLGAYAPRIYLVGWLDLSPPKRRMLEQRGVTPIDIGQLPGAELWNTDVRHRYAMEWFLSALEEAEPYAVANWPTAPPRRAATTSTNLPQVPLDERRLPKPEEQAPEHPIKPDTIEKLTATWCHNRSLYPGWIIAPQVVRHRLWIYTEAWITPVLDSLAAMHISSRVVVLDELCWRLDLCLTPLPPKVSAAVAEAVSGGEPSRPPNDAPRPTSGPDDPLFHTRWLRLVAASLRAAREASDDVAFNCFAAKLDSHKTDESWITSTLEYQKCLRGLELLDHAAVEQSLESLCSDDVDTYWKVRKAGVLAELGRLDESFQLVQEALQEIRQEGAPGEAMIPALSREGWALMLAGGFTFFPHKRRSANFEHADDPEEPRGVEPEEVSSRRWEALRKYDCDARYEFFEALREVKDPPPPGSPAVSERLEFDIGHRTRTQQMQWPRRNLPLLPGRRARRLVEEAGLPPIVDVVSLSEQILLQASVWLERDAPQLALATILRTCRYEHDIFDNFFNRCRIATLSADEVLALISRLELALDFSVPKIFAAFIEDDSDRSIYWLGRVRVAVEALSRLVLRVDEEHAEEVLQRALKFYRLSVFQKNDWLTRPLQHLCYRTLDRLSKDRIQRHLLGFLQLSLPREGDMDVIRLDAWPDLFLHAAERFGEDRPELPPNPAWLQRANDLIELVSAGPLPYPRWLAIGRLEVLLRWEILTDHETRRLADATWQHRLPGGGFPEGRRFERLDYLFLNLPEPEPGIAADLFRQRYLQRTPKAPGLSAQYFWNLLGADEAGFEFGPLDAERLLVNVLTDWKAGLFRRAVEEPHQWRSQFDLEDYQSAVAEALGRLILPRLDRQSKLIGETEAMISDLRTLDYPVEATYPALTRLMPDLLPDLTDRLRQGIVSSKHDQANASVSAVLWWVHRGQVFGSGEPTPDLVREIAIAISMRRPSLKQALRSVDRIFASQKLTEPDRFAGLVAEGLSYLLSEASYQNAIDSGHESTLRPNEVSEVRMLCARAALALANSGYKFSSVDEWLRQAGVDPLPEVRHVIEEARRD